MRIVHACLFRVKFAEKRPLLLLLFFSIRRHESLTCVWFHHLSSLMRPHGYPPSLSIRRHESRSCAPFDSRESAIALQKSFTKSQLGDDTTIFIVVRHSVFNGLCNIYILISKQRWPISCIIVWRCCLIAMVNTKKLLFVIFCYVWNGTLRRNTLL